MIITSREHVYYADKEIWVTDLRVIALGMYYWYDRALKVRIKAVDYGKQLRNWILLYCALALLSFFTLRLMFQQDSTNSPFLPGLDAVGDYLFWGIIAFVLVLSVLVISLIPRFPKGSFYVVKLEYRFSSKSVFASIDKVRAERVLHEIEMALAQQKAAARVRHEVTKPISLPPLADDTQMGGRPPVIVGDLMVAGDNVYLVSAMNRAMLQATYTRLNSPWVVWSFVFMLSNLATYAGKHYGGVLSLLSGVMPVFTVVGFVWAFLFLGARQDQTTYLVVARGNFGNMIVFASLDKGEAKDVRDEIIAAIGTAPSHAYMQPSAGGG